MYHKLLTLSLLSLTFALLPLMSKSQEKEHVVLIETNMGNLKAKLYNDTPLHRDHDHQNIRCDDFYRVRADNIAPVAECDKPVIFL